MLDYNNFYHASNIGNLTELLPLSNAKDSGEKVCYFTPVKAYAVFYLRDKEINHVTCSVTDKGITVYREQFPSQLKKTYQGRSGYLYTCKNNNNIKQAHTDGIWTSVQPVAVSSVCYIEDVYAEILEREKSGEVQIIRYESLSDGQKRENAEVIKDFIIQRGFLTAGTPQARFFNENYPQAWEEAEKSVLI